MWVSLEVGHVPLPVRDHRLPTAHQTGCCTGEAWALERQGTVLEVIPLWAISFVLLQDIRGEVWLGLNLPLLGGGQRVTPSSSWAQAGRPMHVNSVCDCMCE